MRATIREVAREAGVSPSTVSRALSMPGLVNPVTRERVLRAAQRLGYEPNRAARGLITGRTGNLGLIVPDLANPFFPSLVKGVQARAREADYAVFLADTDEDPAAESHLVRVLAKQVDGLILCSPRAREEDILALAGTTTLVMVNRRFGKVPSVVFDNSDGIRQAVAHLQALGHRRVAWVGGPRTSWSNRERVRALRSATAAAGMELLVVGQFPPQFEGGIAAADLIIASGVTSVVAYNDVMALGLLGRLRDRGVHVPQDFSVIGIDDIQMSGMSSPTLTTVSLTKEQAGRAAVDLLLSLLEQPDGVRNVRRELPTQLRVRGSTGVARAN
ncbi:LacI family DNA-binding transcriptional regulator [Micromonospora sp. U56]|nr:LacI family DNA-binding transcriptional regulator [Micromonospora sp. U56]